MRGEWTEFRGLDASARRVAVKAALAEGACNSRCMRTRLTQDRYIASVRETALVLVELVNRGEAQVFNGVYSLVKQEAKV